MRINGRTYQDDDVIIDVKKAWEAYQIFADKRRPANHRDERNAEHANKQASGQAAVEFDKAIKSRLASLQANFPSADYALAAKQTLSGWNRNPQKVPIKRKRSVLIAVLSITGKDISANNILARQPINLSALADLAPLQSRKITNDPDEVEEVVYEIELAELIFKSAEMTVLSDWLIKPDGKAAKSEAYEVGSVTVGLKEADIEIDFGHTQPVEWTRRVTAETDPFNGRADGCVIMWSENRQAWLVQPTDGSPMRVRAENVKLCKTKGPRGSFVDLKVIATDDQLFSDFRMRRRAGPAGNAMSVGDFGLAGDERDHARARLFSIILAHRVDAASILSFQRHKLP